PAPERFARGRVDRPVHLRHLAELTKHMNQRWYSGTDRGQWLALAAALLGWAFDGFEQGVFPLMARPALIELLGLEEHVRDMNDGSLSDEKREAARAAVNVPVGRWNAVVNASFLFGAATGGV